MMSSATPTNQDSRGISDPIATLQMRLDKQMSVDLEKSKGTSVVYQTIEVFPAADNVAIIRGTPHYFRDDHSIITLSPTEQRAEVCFGSTAVPRRDDPSTLDIRAYADIKGLGCLSKLVTDLSSLPDGYKRGDSLGRDYESLRCEFVSLALRLSGVELQQPTADTAQWSGARIALGLHAQTWAKKGVVKSLQMRKNSSHSATSHPQTDATERVSKRRQSF